MNKIRVRSIGALTALTEENRYNGREKCPSVILSTIWTGLGSNQGPRNERPATNSLSKLNYATDVTVPRRKIEPTITTLRKAHHTVTTDGLPPISKTISIPMVS